tara:strand:+ start:63 stop:509 length:447 start_codon:yes stop_codon:yes gene_type:complete
MKKFLYFRSVEDEDNDDGQETGATQKTSLLLPADRVRGITPASDTTIKIVFDSVRNGGALGMGAADTATEVVVADSVTLTIDQGNAEDVMKALVQAVYGARSPFSNGVIVIADDVTTNFANNTVAAKTVHPNLTGIATDNIVIAEANA